MLTAQKNYEENFSLTTDRTPVAADNMPLRVDKHYHKAIWSKLNQHDRKMDGHFGSIIENKNIHDLLHDAYLCKLASFPAKPSNADQEEAEVQMQLYV